MMDCAHYRRQMLADPKNAGEQLREHTLGCPDCNQFTERLLRFESRLERALRVTAPAGARVRALRPAALRTGGLALAASVLLAVVVAGALWLAVPHPSLAADVVTHMADEPQAWRSTDVAVPPPDLNLVLRDSHLRLTGGAGVVSYAASCRFRGNRVPHLVVQTGAGPITVMVLVHESVRQPVQFAEAGYRGVIVPVAGHGSMAVLGRGPSTDIGAVQRIAARVLDSITWIP